MMFVLAMESSGSGRRQASPSDNRFSVAMAEGSHPFPFRTRKLSPPAPMVLGRRLPGRVGRRRISLWKRAAYGRSSSRFRTSGRISEHACPHDRESRIRPHGTSPASRRQSPRRPPIRRRPPVRRPGERGRRGASWCRRRSRRRARRRLVKGQGFGRRWLAWLACLVG
jgi:hypothetical protein